MQTAQVDEVTTLAKDAMDAFNAGDFARFRTFLAPTVVYEESGTGRQAHGADAYIAGLEAWQRAFSELKGAITQIIVSGEQFAERITWTGTHTGPLETPSMTFPPTGRAFQGEASMWGTVKDGKMTAVFHQLDMLGLLLQLGLLGAPQAQELKSLQPGTVDSPRPA